MRIYIIISVVLNAIKWFVLCLCGNFIHKGIFEFYYFILILNYVKILIIQQIMHNYYRLF